MTYVRLTSLLVFLLVAASIEARPINQSLIGRWEGSLTIVHAPAFPDADPTLDYRFDIEQDKMEFYFYREEEQRWSKFNTPERIGMSVYGAMYALANNQPGFNETISIHIVQLDESRLFVYLSRVVDNIALESDASMRHFPVFAEGEVKRVGDPK